MKKGNSPKVSVVIPMYKSRPYLDLCLKSVLGLKYPNFEVVVVIDGGDDETGKIIKKNFKDKKLKIVDLQDRVWLSGTRSIGFQKSTGKYVALLDHDVEVDEKWLTEHVKVLESDENIAATQGKTIDIKQRNVIQTTAIKLYKQFGWVKCQGLGEKDKGQYDKQEPSLAGATNAVFRKSVVNKLGYYDKQLKFNIDDLDLAIRLWIAGYKTVTAHKGVIYHWTAKTKKLRGQMIGRMKWEYEFAKSPRIILKNYEAINIIRYLPTVYGVLFSRGVINLFRGNMAPLGGLIGATVWNIKNIFDTLEARKKVQANRKVNDKEWMDQVSVEGNLLTIVNRSVLPSREKAIKVFSN